MNTKAEALRRRLARKHGSSAQALSVSDAGSLIEAFNRVSDRYADRLAVRFDGQSMTYRELDQRSSALATALRATSEPRGLVGVLLERSPDLIVAAVATIKAGMAYLPLDLDSPPARLAAIVQDAAPATVITSRALAGRVPDGVRTLFIDDPLPGSEPGDVRADGSDRAYVIFTSGTTGRPKGVEVSHHNLLRLFSSTEGLFGFGHDDVWTMFHSFAFDFSVWEMWGALLYGGCVVVVPPDVARDAVAFRRLLRDEQVTVLSQTPTAFLSLTVAEDRGWPDRLPLKWIVFGGEALHFPDLARWVNRYGDDQPQLINMYGITETAVQATYRRVRRTELAESRSLIGQPLPDLRFVLTDDQLEPVSTGQVGEIVVTGAGVALGYLGHPELTRERFVELPGTGVRGYRSGDLARQTPDGDLEYLGRKDDQVKIRGYRIELGEIRSALTGLDVVTSAAVVTRDLPGRGDSLVAYVVGDASPQHLRAELSRLLPGHMIPSAFVFLPELPRTHNGKLDRAALPDPESRAEIQDQTDDEVEARILTRAAALVAPNPVSRTASFFDLGGHSLLATRLLAEINDDFGVDVRLRDFLRAPSVQGLAKLVRDRQSKQPRARTGLVELRQEAGDAVPVFAIPGVLGLGTSFTRLCGHLPGRTFSALHLGDFVDEHTSTADLVDRCAAIVSGEVTQSVHLVGHSIGGPLALHLVDALRDRHIAVASLTLLDAPTPAWLEARPERARDEHLWYFLAELTVVFPELADAWQDELGREPRVEKEILTVAERLADQTVTAVLENDLTSAFEHYLRMNRLRWPELRPQHVPGILLRATDRPHATGDHTAGWEHCLPDALTVTDVAATHEGMLRDPHVGDVARLVQRFLTDHDRRIHVPKENTA